MKNHLYSMIFAWLCFCSQAFAQSEPSLSLPSILSDHMVLQQNSKVKFWGWSNPRTTVHIIPSWGKDTLVVKTDNTARFEAELQTPPTSKNTYQIEVRIKDRSLIIEDVLIGEVWLCSGQSNMEWNSTKGIKDIKDELPHANNSEIRLFTVEKQTSAYPQDNCRGRWMVCSSQSLKLFSAVGYFFGKKLNQELDCPIGLINSSWGGTNIETWMPQEAMNEHPDFTKAVQVLTPSAGWDIAPSTTYNAMIYPLISTRLAGVIWYQGEANLANGNYYANMFTSMIKAWRRCFSNAELPFYYVQIAPYARYKFAPRAAAQVREQQYKVSKLPHVGMVAVPDYVNNIKDIHPIYKQPVGNRLAHWALSEKYNKKVADYRHPSFLKMEREKNKIRIWFNHAETGLVCRGKEPVTLEIAAEDMNFIPAKGKIDKKTNTLIVTSTKIKEPVAVRYSFTNEAIGNLFCTNGLPVLPFRTDNEAIEIYQNLQAQKVLLKGDMVDICTVAPQTELFLKSNLFKFNNEINHNIQGKMFVRRFEHSQSPIKIKSERPVTVYLASTMPVTHKDWKLLNESFSVGNRLFHLHSYELKDNKWITVPDMNGNSSLLFAPQIERVDIPTVPGKVIYNSDNSDRNFVTDPALVILPNGDYVAGCRARFNGNTGFVRLYRSADKGKTWEILSDIPEVGFYNIFVHNSALYLMGTKGGFNHMVILRSDDGGRSWTTPTDSKHGLLSGETKSYHSASVPVVYAKGRIWRAMEDNQPKGKRYFRAFMMSAPVHANLLDSASWTRSEALPYDSTWLGTDRTFNGWLEGNAVVTREGNVADVLRIEERNLDGKAAIVNISDDGKRAYFNPQKDIIDLPGASKKFVIRFDSISNLYWAITNHVFKQDLGKEHCGLLRNRLVLISSPDLRNWQIQEVLISHDDPHFHGFQYIDWLIEEDDIIAVSRTAFDDKNGLPQRQHDANYLTFHRFKSFRKCLKTNK